MSLATGRSPEKARRVRRRARNFHEGEGEGDVDDAAPAPTIPFAAFYRVEGGGARARLIATMGINGRSPLPQVVPLDRPARADRWRIAAVVRTARAASIDDLRRIKGLQPTRQALVLPVRGSRPDNSNAVVGVLVAGLDPRQAADAGHRSFLERLAAQIGSGLADGAAGVQIRDLAANNLALVRLHELSADLRGRRALPDVLQAALDAAITLTGAQMGTLQLHDAQTDVLQIVAQTGFDDAFFGFFKVVRANAPSVCGEALRRHQRVIVEDVQSDPMLRDSPEVTVLAAAGVAAVQSTPIVARDGAILGMISTHWRRPQRPAEITLRLLDLLVRQIGDLIESRRATEALHRTEAALRDADRRKDEFISILSHELRNPLAPITTAVQLMRMHGDRPSPEELDLIDRQARHMSRLVDDLLDVTRVTQGRVPLNKASLRLKDVIARGVEMAMPLIEERHHNLEVLPSSGALRVLGDEGRLAQIFGNLLTNAAKYTDPGGVITVRGRREGAHIVVEIEDDGIGIAADLLPHVFDLFVQARQPADRALGGLGIGLTIVRSLVELHGGDVIAESPGAGRGARFTVRLPSANEAAATAESPARTTADVPHRRQRVLLVDDNPDILQPLAQLLKRIGHDVRTASDGPAALDVMRKFNAQVAILDIGLPVMDGYTLAGRLRAQLGKTTPRLIAMSGYGQAADRARSDRAGFSLHMTKPVDPQVLIAAIDDIGQRSNGNGAGNRNGNGRSRSSTAS